MLPERLINHTDFIKLKQKDNSKKSNKKNRKFLK